MSENIAPGPPPPAPLPFPSAAAPDPADGPVCPQCGAKRITSAMQPCWLCGAILPKLDSPLAAGPVRGREDNPAFIVIGVLLILVMVGLAVEAPGLLVVLALAATPALIRSMVVARRAKAAGQPLSGAEKVGGFLGALGSVFLIGAAAWVAFYATCFAVCLGMLAVDERAHHEGLILTVSVLAGLVPGIAVLVWLIRIIYLRRRA
jgi:hypothetical protein